jgi:hypothetical protein
MNTITAVPAEKPSVPEDGLHLLEVKTVTAEELRRFSETYNNHVVSMISLYRNIPSRAETMHTVDKQSMPSNFKKRARAV